MSTTGAASRRPVRRSTSRSRKRGRSARCARRGPRRRRSRGSGAPPARRAAPAQLGVVMPVSAPIAAAAARPGRRASGRSRRARAPPRARRRSRRCATVPARAGRLEVDDDVGRLLQRRRAGRLRERDARRARRAGVAGDDVVEQRRASPAGRGASANSAPRRLLGRRGAAPLLDELDEPVCRIERELHAAQPRRTYVRLASAERGAALAAASQIGRGAGATALTASSASCRRRTSAPVAAGMCTFCHGFRGLTPSRAARCEVENFPNR